MIMNYDENRCYVVLSVFEPELPQSRREEFAKVANSHGWKANWGNLE